jgi:hypothetical protein
MGDMRSASVDYLTKESTENSKNKDHGLCGARFYSIGLSPRKTAHFRVDSTILVLNI